MVDEIVIYTPLLVLGVVLLLGFAGCHRVFGLEYVEPDPPPPGPYVRLRARVPTALAVRDIVFVWDPPNVDGGSETLDKPTPSSQDGNDNLFDFDLKMEPDDGSWTVTCTVRVTGGTGQGASAMGTFTLPGTSVPPVATFQATGGPTELAVMFVGLS